MPAAAEFTIPPRQLANRRTSEKSGPQNISLIRTMALLAATAALLAQMPKGEAAELAQRRDIGPTDRAKVLSLQSKRWLGFGATGQTTESSVVPGTVGSRVCTTNVGVPQNNSAGSGNGSFGLRTGSARRRRKTTSSS